MATRIIEINECEYQIPEWRGWFDQSQITRNGIARIKSGDIIYVFVHSDNVYHGNIKYRCKVAATYRYGKNGEPFTKLVLTHEFNNGICTYKDLIRAGFVKWHRFHFNITPGLDRYMSAKGCRWRPRHRSRQGRLISR